MKLCLAFLVISSIAATCCFGQDKCGLAFVAPVNDSTQLEVFLHYDESGEPVHYSGHVDAAVCEDGLCKLLVIDIFWDLLGNFLKYELPPGEALTKLDHEEFSGDDHTKLRRILSDKASILRDYRLEDLIVRPVLAQSRDVDAVTAATRADVKDAVVGGAVYSTYVLWHIVNGPISFRIEQYSKPFLTEERIGRMFYSDNFYYQYYALNSVSREDSPEYTDGVVHLVANGRDYIPYFAIEKVPGAAWRDAKYQQILLPVLGTADFELQNAILDRLSGVTLDQRALTLLATSLDGLTDRQLMKALEVITVNRDRLDEHSRKILLRYSDRHDKRVSEMINALLKNYTKDRKRNK